MTNISSSLLAVKNKNTISVIENNRCLSVNAFFCCIILSLVCYSATSQNVRGKTKPANHSGWTPLLDKNLSRWGNYLAYSHKPDYNGKKPVDEKGFEIAPVGYNHDNKHVFSTIEEQGQPVLHVSGELYGCLFTNEEYGNFHLKLKVKWGKNMYGPRVGKLKDSGILYYSIGEAGADYWRAWMLSQEFQIMQGHIGDYWNIANSAIDIRAYQAEGKMNSLADAKQSFLGFGTGNPDGLCLGSGNYENPGSEWNIIELVCFKGKSLHIVNGHVVMVLQNSHYVNNGRSIPLNKGKIQLQSEGSEVYYKDIQIKNLSAMPKEYQRYYN
jgi:hypothetical protein